VWVLRELGAQDKADDLIARFLGRNTKVNTYASYPFKELIRDEKFLRQWKDHTEKDVPDERTLEETLNAYHYEKGRAMEDLRRLAEFSEYQYHDWFKATTNPKVLSIASALAHMQNRLPLAAAEIEKIEKNVLAALLCISTEDKLSEARLRCILQMDGGQFTPSRAAGEGHHRDAAEQCGIRQEPARGEAR
jgi:hypothetical protein